MDQRAVGILFGGKSSEHDVSLTSGRSVLKAINQERFISLPIIITRQGEWFLLENPGILINNEKPFLSAADCPVETLLPVMIDYTRTGSLISLQNGDERRWHLDVVFPVLHGPGGEDGSIQGLLQLANIPYVGPGILGSALGLDKVLAKVVAERHGIPITPYRAVMLREWRTNSSQIANDAIASFGLPLFVKPANCGSSIGIRKVSTRETLKEAVEYALQFDRKILIEKAINARELECGVLGNDQPKASVVGEVIPCNEFYDYQAKYLANSRTIIPAPIPDEMSQQIRELAVKVFLALDCCGMGRVDFLVDRNSQDIYFNEINTIPGFTLVSMFPKMWEAAGISYGELITELLELAIEQAAYSPQRGSRLAGPRPEQSEGQRMPKRST